MLPPRWLRRLLLAPTTIALATLYLFTAPLWLFAAAAASPLVPGRLRPLRLLWMATLHLVFEALILIVLFGLWLAAGLGYNLQRPWFQRRHYDLMRWYLRVIYAEARRVLHVRVSVEGPPPEAYRDRPLLVFSRHAGPGDSFLLMHALLNWYGREPRIVLKHTLQWDPAIDALLNRLPTVFIPPGPRDAVEDRIRELSTGLDGDDAVVIFPEGGNFTEGRRARAIARLRQIGLEPMARRAEAMRYVLAPRPGGVTAALEAAAPGAYVAWVAHTGVDHLQTVLDVWRELPMDKGIAMHWWLCPPEEIPSGREERTEWLYGWWERIDAWIAAQRTTPPED
ncbi:MAG: 1-acyl-sn-glycerol-3-phosphate acyltransferase [Streptosporangiales bacterium]|nr:1-acyl-sn-glycerol-3-phosphate acyltransferase [Streptosporangiales bacterium]